MARVVQITLDLDAITASLDPDPAGVYQRLARGRGLAGQDLAPLSEDRLSGSLRITLTEDQALALQDEISRGLS